MALRVYEAKIDMARGTSLLGDNSYLKDKVERANTLKEEISMITEIKEKIKAKI
jgi:hypothetical protein